MGKKGGWFSAIKKVFAHSSKDKPTDGSSSDKKINSEKKKKGKGILRNGENRSFLPLFKEPSSIEKILGEADQLFIRPSHITTTSASSLPHDPVRTDVPEKQTLPRIASSPSKSASFSSSLPVNASASSSSSSRVNNNSNNHNNISSPKAEKSAPLKAASASSKALPQKPNVASPSVKANNAKVVIEPSKAASASSKALPQKPTVASPSVEANYPKVVIEPSKAASASSKAPPQKPIAASPSVDAHNPKVVIEKRENHQKQISEYPQRPEPTLRYQQLSATKIQAAFRGYLARRSFKALRGLVRLQGVVRGQNVRRQTANAMKQMQLLVRVQTQIQSRRIQMLENQAMLKCKKDVESTSSKWTNQLPEIMDNEEWDDSIVTKEEADTRLRRKVEAVIKRERAMAYAYSRQLRGENPNSAQASYQDIRSNGLPRWWNWLERQLPQTTSNSQNQTNPKSTFTLTPPRAAASDYGNKRPTFLNNYYSNKPVNIPATENQEPLTPPSSMSQATSIKGKQLHKLLHTPSRTPPPPPRKPYNYSPASSSVKRYKPRVSEVNSSYNDVPLRDDDSLVSCPPFSAPRYMMPTVSAKAKVRSNSNLKDWFMGTPGNESKKRFSFPLTPRWSYNSSKGSNSGSNRRALEKRDSSLSIGDLSIDSTVSMPVIVGRKPFNRFA